MVRKLHNSFYVLWSPKQINPCCTSMHLLQSKLCLHKDFSNCTSSWLILLGLKSLPGSSFLLSITNPRLFEPWKVGGESSHEASIINITSSIFIGKFNIYVYQANKINIQALFSKYICRIFTLV